MSGIVLTFTLAYFIGSIPFGLILTKVFAKQDIRTVGSGNIGATNVLRTGNKLLALLTLLLDGAKGAVAILLLPVLLPYGASLIAIGLFATLGHCFPVWLKFKGGKGVATTAGVLLAAVPLAGVIALGVWVAMVFAFRVSSLAALVAAFVAPIATFFFYGAAPAGITLMIALLVFWRHKENIQRLLKGEEPKVGKK